MPFQGLKIGIKKINIGDSFLKRLPDDPRKLLALSLAAALFLVFVFHNLLYRPKLKEFSRLVPEVAGLRNDITALKRDYADIEGLKMELERGREVYDENRDKLISEEGLPALLSGISELAASLGIDVVSLTPQAAREEAGSYKTARIDMQLISSYHALGRFLNKLESGRWLFEVVDIDISSRASEPGRHSVRISTRVFIQPEGS